MPPVPAPVADQVEKVREIARLRTYSHAAALVDGLNDTQWANTLDDIDEWGTVRDDYTEIEKGLLGANISPEQQRLKITNRVRERLGLYPLNLAGREISSAVTTFSESIPIEPVF